MNLRERKMLTNGFAICLFVILLVSLFAGCTTNNQPSKPNRPPSAIISSPHNNATFEVGDEITFDGLESKDPEGKEVLFSWSLGDGTIKKEGKFVYSYSSARTYEIVLGTSDGKKTNSTKIKIIVKEANRAPEPLFVYGNNFTRVGVPIWFNGSLTSDPDGNEINYTWYFGDGSSVSGINLTNVTHAYSKPGCYTVCLDASDGRLSKNITREISVFGEIDILVDWNMSEYNYIIKVEGPLNSTHLSANVKDETSNAVWTANIEEVENSNGYVSCKLKSSLVPSAGHQISVNVLYFGRELSSRKINVSGENLAPFGNYEIGYEITLNSTKQSMEGRKTEFMNLTGFGKMNISGNLVEMSICANGTLYSYEKTENNGSKVLDAEVKNSTFFENYKNGTKLHQSNNMHIFGTLVEKDSEGNETFTASLGMNATVQDKMIVNSSSFMYGIIPSAIPAYMNITTEKIGNGTHANASGIEYECLKILEIQTMDAMMDFNGETWHLWVTNNSIKWVCADETLENTTIYVQFNKTVYIYNATTGELNTIIYENGSFYPDENGDGCENPDRAPIQLDDVFEFSYVIPRELLPGDRVIVNSSMGILLKIEVIGLENVTIDGKDYACVRVNQTYTDNLGLASGLGYALIVYTGNYTGLIAYSTSEQTYAGTSGIEAKKMVLNAVSIREK